MCSCLQLKRDTPHAEGYTRTATKADGAPEGNSEKMYPTSTGAKKQISG